MIVQRSAGFTLIELILVVAIFGVMAAGSLLAINPLEQFKKSNDSKRKSDLAQIQRSLEAYYQDYGRYPLSSSYQIVDTNPVPFGSSWQPYINLLPDDPIETRSYVYYVSANRQSYVIYASLERGANDPDSCNGGDVCTNMSAYGVSGTACGVVCNYGVSSPDIRP